MARNLSSSAVIRWHGRLIFLYGGNPGLLSLHLLESAIAAPRFMRAYGSSDVVVQAAALGYALANNHSFQDGNKRTAFAAMGIFLRRNGYRVHFGVEWVDIMEGVADGGVSRDALVELLRRAL